MPAYLHLTLIAFKLRSLLTFTAMLSLAAVSADDLPKTSSSAIYGDKTSDKRLVIGSVTNAPRYNFGQMQPLSLYMLDQLKDHGIEAIMVVTIDSHEKMVELMRNGRVDWVSATPYAALVYERDANATFLLTKKSRGRGSYRSVFFSRNDSGIKSLNDLKGKKIAFEKLGSTSAYFLPAMELLAAGLNLIQLNSPRDVVPENTVGYLFSGDEANSSIWVHKRIADAAAFSNDDWDSEWRTPIDFRDDIEIFHETEEVPRSLEVIRPGLDPLLATRIKQALLNLNNNADSAEILSGYYRASDFAELTKEQSATLDTIRDSIDIFEVSMAKTISSPIPTPTESTVQARQ